MTTQHISCPHCGSNAPERIINGHYIDVDNDTLVIQFICISCNGVFNVIADLDELETELVRA